MLALSEDTQMLAESAADVLTGHDYPSVIRAQRPLGPAATGFEAEQWQAAVELGWTGIAIPEPLGGLGFPVQGLFGLFESAGRSLAGLPLLTQLVIAPSLLCSASDNWKPRTEAIDSLVQGTQWFGLALDEGTRHAPALCQTLATPCGLGWSLTGHKRYALDATHAQSLLITACLADTQEMALFCIPADTPGVQVDPCALIDQRSRAHVTLSSVALGPDALVYRGAEFTVAMDQALLLGRAVVSAELLGISQTVFDTTLTYLSQREQFDRKLGSFQALQHRMARLHAEIQLARAGVLGAFEALERGPSVATSSAVAMAKFKAGEVSDLATNEATQLHGGMGVTNELNIGLFLKRARVAEALLGDQTYQLAQLTSLEGASA